MIHFESNTRSTIHDKEPSIGRQRSLKSLRRTREKQLKFSAREINGTNKNNDENCFSTPLKLHLNMYLIDG